MCDLHCKARCGDFVPRKVPVDGGQEFARSFFMKLNASWGHAGVWRRLGIGLPATGGFLLDRNPRRRPVGRFPPATRLRRPDPATPQDYSTAMPRGLHVLLLREREPVAKAQWNARS